MYYPPMFIHTRRFVLLFVCAIAGAWGLRVAAQSFGGQAAPLPPPINQSSDRLLKNFRFRSIGPANIGGRVDDIAVVESNPSVIYIGLATGGVFKTVNNGTTWTPIFEIYSTASIGDVAVSQKNPDTVWVGTGEANNRGARHSAMASISRPTAARRS